MNINIPKVDKPSRPKPKGGPGLGGLLPPPPGGIPAPPGSSKVAVPGTANLTPLSSPTDAAKSVIGELKNMATGR